MLNPDFIVIGAGITGVRAAIELAPHGQVLVLTSMALVRQESRGAHYRTDYPTRNDRLWRRRITARYDPQKASVIFEALSINQEQRFQQSIDPVTIS